jgi:hypothetical protein
LLQPSANLTLMNIGMWLANHRTMSASWRMLGEFDLPTATGFGGWVELLMVQSPATLLGSGARLVSGES